MLRANKASEIVEAETLSPEDTRAHLPTLTAALRARSAQERGQSTTWISPAPEARDSLSPLAGDAPVVGNPVIRDNRLFWTRVPYFTLPSWWRRGVTRECLLIGRYAFKIPSWASWEYWLMGMLNNKHEHELSRVFPHLVCPILFRIRGGFLNVMPRARMLTPDEWQAFTAEMEATDWAKWASIAVERKLDSFGIVSGRIVALDYAAIREACHADLVRTPSQR
jgi:hypothetical protein